MTDTVWWLTPCSDYALCLSFICLQWYGKLHRFCLCQRSQFSPYGVEATFAYDHTIPCYHPGPAIRRVKTALSCLQFNAARTRRSRVLPRGFSCFFSCFFRVVDTRRDWRCLTRGDLAKSQYISVFEAYSLLPVHFAHTQSLFRFRNYLVVHYDFLVFLFLAIFKYGSQKVESTEDVWEREGGGLTDHPWSGRDFARKYQISTNHVSEYC